MAATRSASRSTTTTRARSPKATQSPVAPAPTTETPAPAMKVSVAPAAPVSAPAPIQTNDANLKPIHISHEVLVNSIKSANAGFKAAVSLEIAVVCAVFIDVGDTGTNAKKELYSIYKDAGYDCEVGGKGADYKTVNRRINYATKFFESLPKDELKTVMGASRDDMAINTLMVHISGKYGLKSMSDVIAASGATPPSRQPRLADSTQPRNQQGGSDNQQGGNTGGTGGGNAGPGPQGGGTATEQGQGVFHTSATATPTGVPQGQPSESDHAVMAAMQQAEAQRLSAPVNPSELRLDPAKWFSFTYEGATVFLPTDLKTECLIDLGLKLAEVGHHTKTRTIDVTVLNEQFAKEAVAH